jgi:dTDP-4-dehydrorhamnose 3,5-epimerase-like enzyme
MKVEETALPGVLLLSPTIYRDGRGAFFETWNQRAMAARKLGSGQFFHLEEKRARCP